MAVTICVYWTGDAWALVGPDGFSNETGGYPPGWCDAASPEEMAVAKAIHLEVPDVPAGMVREGWEVVGPENDPEVEVDQRAMTVEEVAGLTVQRISEVKAEASRRILAAFPTWKQANMNMRATELVDLRVDGSLTVEQEAERQALITASAWIKGVREASNLIEADLPADAAGLVLFAAAEAAGWPA